MSVTKSFQVGVTLYSFTNEYLSYKWSFEDLMQKAAELGPGQGVEIVGPQHHRCFPEVSNEFERIFKSSCERNHLTPTSYGAYADPGMVPGRSLTPDELVEYTIPQLKGARKLGFPVVRIQYFLAPVIEKVLSYAEKYKVKIGYELHTPLIIESPEAQAAVGQVKKLQSEYFGVIPDAGIFAKSIPKLVFQAAQRAGVPPKIMARLNELWTAKAEPAAAQAELKSLGADYQALGIAALCWDVLGHSDPKSLAQIMPYIIHVHGKFYSMENGEEPNIRYQEFVRALVEGGYKGWMSSEYEGHGFAPDADAFALVKAQQAMVKRYIAKYSKG